MIRIAPSTNPSPESKLLEYARHVQKNGADYLHCDVMDGQFVEQKCLPIEKISEVSFGTLLPIDIHLMVADPVSMVPKLTLTKPNYITIHYESFDTNEEVFKAIKLIKHYGILAGLSIKPSTKVEKLIPFLNDVNLVLIMSVEPGKSGQAFIESTFEKFEFINNYRKQHNLNFKLQADGGVNEHNIEKLYQLGVDIAVVGSALYNAPNKKIYIDKLKKLSEQN